MDNLSLFLENEEYFANPNNSYSLHSICLIHKFSPKSTPMERWLDVRAVNPGTFMSVLCQGINWSISKKSSNELVFAVI